MWRGLVLVCCLFSVVQGRNDFYVAVNGTSIICTYEAPCGSISAGMTAACASPSSSDVVTVWVHPGTYQIVENVVWDCNLHLR